MITIVTVNWNAYDFVDLLIESLRVFSHAAHELIVIDNSDRPQTIDRPHVTQFQMPTNIGHGRGLNHGVVKALDLFPKNPFLMFLDCDCHFLKPGWEAAFVGKMKEFDIVGGKGVPSKPIRPACMFMRRAVPRHDWADSHGYKGNRLTPEGYDVAIKAYYKIMAGNGRIGFLQPAANRYGTLNGEEWQVGGESYVYHHWHGTHLPERQADFPNADLAADKAKLFASIPWRLP
jgi:glycosyltransferase involved in cell wall biosynthesis